MKSMWNGAISFGLVNVPVAMYKATEAKDRAGVSFKLIHEPCKAPITLVKKCRDCLETVIEPGRGVEIGLGKSKYIVPIPRADIDRVNDAFENSRAIEVSQFVERGDVDPVYFGDAYYLAPNGAAMAYETMRTAMASSDLDAVGRVTTSGKEKLVLIRQEHGLLFCYRLNWHADVRSFEFIRGQVGGSPDAKSVEMARTIIESMVEPWNPQALTPTQRDAMREMVDAHIAGSGWVAPEQQEADVIPFESAIIKAYEAAKKKPRKKAA